MNYPNYMGCLPRTHQVNLLPIQQLILDKIKHKIKLLKIENFKKIKKKRRNQIILSFDFNF